MEKIRADQLYSLEEYSRIRSDFRNRVMEHKGRRRLAIGPHVTLFFEDRLTMQYQVQEMLRVERIFEADGIRDELDAYNPLIPDGRNWKATMMIEYPDVDQRQRELRELLGIEDSVWVRVPGFDPVFAVADEDLDRASEDKTSSVHFLRFELTPPMSEALRGGASLTAGIEHRNYRHHVDPVPEPLLESLVGDLD